MDTPITDGAGGAPGWRGDYVLWTEPLEKHVRVEFGGVAIAESNDVLFLHETRHRPVFYFPRKDVRTDLLQRSDHETHCPFKGMATHWNISAGGRSAENAAWSYEEPFADAKDLGQHVAFYWDQMDRWVVDGVAADKPPHERGNATENPLMEWLLTESWIPRTVRDLLREFGERLAAAGMPVERMRLVIRTLHPQLYGRAYTWNRGEHEIDVYQATHEVLEMDSFRNSPFHAIIDGAAGIRRRLEGDNPQLDYKILGELRDDGFTDYVCMPMTFSDGQINVISLSSKAPGGFSTSDLGHIYEILPVLSRMFEAHNTRTTAVTLLDTYLGQQTGRRVLEGRIKRGDGDNLYAVIWFCDLRNSTALSESLPREEFLMMLNQFLEAMAGAVLDAGGEVLRYIGDAALAIFPITDDVGLGAPVATRKAADAARDALKRMDEVNAARAAEGKDAIGYGIGLHLGHVTYGNIGSPGRLEFTVIGAAANEASRIEGLTKELGQRVVISDSFDKCYPSKLVPLGRHALRGVADARDVFTLPVPVADAPDTAA